MGQPRTHPAAQHRGLSRDKPSFYQSLGYLTPRGCQAICSGTKRRKSIITIRFRNAAGFLASARRVFPTVKFEQPENLARVRPRYAGLPAPARWNLT